MWYMKKFEYIFFLAILTTLGVVLYVQEHPRVVPWNTPPALVATVFAVGQGDAIFIENEQGQQMLIDGGPDDTVLAKLGAAMPYSDRIIDFVVLTHPDADHVTGLISVLRRYEVTTVVLTGVLHATPPYQAFLDELKKQNIAVEFVEGPYELDFAGASVLYPFEPLKDQWVESVNDSSIVLKIEEGSHAIILTGDAERAVEQELVAAGAELRADVLKVGHHGSRTSSTEEFLDAVRPDYALISAGKENRFGHPHREVVRRLQDQGAHVFRTDELGDPSIHVDEEGLCIFAGSAILDCTNK
jgi:competence protein ComEC